MIKVCPTDSKMFKAYVDFIGGDFGKAMSLYTKNNYEYPSDFLEHYEKVATSEDTPISVEASNSLERKKELLEKARAVLIKKIQKLSTWVKKNENLREPLSKLENLLKQLAKLETDKALVTFIQEAETMSIWAEGMIKSYKQDPSSVSLHQLKSILDYVKSFDILNDIKESDFQEEFKPDMDLIKNLAGRREVIKKEFIEMAIPKIAKSWSKAGFNKLYLIEKVKAEKTFLSQVLPSLKGQNSKVISEKKEEYINNWMVLRANDLRVETENYINNLLKKTFDIDSASAYMINPKDIKHDIIQSIIKQLDTEDFIGHSKKEKTLYELTESYNNFVKYVGKSTDPKKLYKDFITKETLIDGTKIDVIINPNSENWKEFEEKYKNTPVFDYWEKISQIIQEKDSLVPSSKKLGYVLPSINKNNFERLATSSPFEFLKETITDPFIVKNTDTSFGETTSNVITDEAGQERKRVPLFYRGEISEKDKSFDITSILFLDYVNSVDYSTRLNNLIVVESIKEIVNETEFIQTTSLGNKIKVDQFNNEVVTKGNSNLAVALDSLIEQRIYGINIKGDPKVAKVAKSFQNYTSMLGLAVNWISGLANVLQGTTVSWIDSIGKNTGYYNVSDRAKAVLDYDKEMASGKLLADVEARVPTSKTNLLRNHLNAFSEGINTQRFLNDNKLKRLTNSSSLLFLNNIGEHATQSIVMYSILNNIKVLDSEGNYLNKEFKPTTAIEEAISLNDAYTVVEGKLTLNPAVASTTKTEGVSTKDLAQISMMIRSANRELFGNYDSNNKAAFQRTVIGSLAFQMRGWMATGIQKRWRGIGSINTNIQDLRPDQVYYNASGDLLQEGSYTSFIRFLNNVRKDLKSLKLLAVSSNWNSLTDYEKANVKKTILEIGLAVLALTLSLAFKGEDDDDENVIAALMARRLYSELITFVNPLEAVRTFRNPLMVLNTVNDGLNVVIQLTDPDEVYSTGKREGDYKIVYKLQKLIPIWKQLDRDPKESLTFLER